MILLFDYWWGTIEAVQGRRWIEIDEFQIYRVVKSIESDVVDGEYLEFEFGLECESVIWNFETHICFWLWDYSKYLSCETPLIIHGVI